MIAAGERRVRFRELHGREGLFLLPNPWDAGSARLLAGLGFEALATTSSGFAWSLGKNDGTVTRAELVAHVAELTAATELPLNVDAERCYPDDPGGVAATVGMLAAAGAAGLSVEDWNPAADRVDDVDVATERIAAAVAASRELDEPLVVTGRAENHIRGVDDLDDTIARLLAYRDAGADAVYAPGLTGLAEIAALVDAVRVPVNVLLLRGGPTVAELEGTGVRRVSVGGALAGAAYGAFVGEARRLLADGALSPSGGIPPDLRDTAFGAPAREA